MFHKNEFYRKILDNLFDGVYLVDKKRRITYWNKGAERITGYMSEQVLGHSCYENLLMHVDETGATLCQSACPLMFTMADGHEREAEVYLHHAKGHRVPVLVRAAPLMDETGEIFGAVESFSDNSITIKERRLAETYKQEALKDPLTEVGNRRFIENKLQVAVEETNQLGVENGVLMLDIDHFKRVNDTYGHDRGDEVLKIVANTIKHNIRASDFLGRWGGEEFMVILQDINADLLLNLADKIRVLVGTGQLIVPEGKITVTVSIGATLSRPGDAAQLLYERADHLLYQSKAGGRNLVTVG